MERIQMLDVAVRLDRPIRDYFINNAYYTPGGVLSQRFLQQTVDLVGAERVMFATDYPFVYAYEKHTGAMQWPGLGRLTDGGGRRFLVEADLSQAEGIDRAWQLGTIDRCHFRTGLMFRQPEFMRLA